MVDEKGHEYVGLGLSKTKDGTYRSVLGMDDPAVVESMHMFILEDRNRGLQIASGCRITTWLRAQG